MYEPWFVWAVIGIACIGLEMIMPGFVIFFFGLGALATALCTLVPFLAGIVWLQVFVFVAFSTLSLVFLRRRFTRIFAGSVFDSKKGNPEEEGIGGIAEVTETAGSVKEGRIRFMGTTWKARTRAGEIPAGANARILERDGMTYIIEPADGAGK
jgi:membrane protein implicated in regulation of membrane protease activity